MGVLGGLGVLGCLSSIIKPMLRRIRRLIPNSFVNYGKHLPAAVLANLRYGFPGRKIKVIGVSGTDGKTTTVNMLYKILKDAGKKVSMISTINAEIAGKTFDTGFHVTSPDRADVQKFLRQAVKTGDEFMILEVTSHGLAQFRAWGIPFEIGVITNITHEHLDYHGSYDNYLNAKSLLIKNARCVVLNQDDASFEKLRGKTSGRIFTYGLKKNSDLNPQNFPLKLKLPGEYNLYNAEAAALVGKILGIDKGVIKRSLENFTSLIGRMEKIKNNRGIKVVVDFAHTPNALENALKALRPQTSGRLISVFGCAGARDIGKRPMMGEISAKLADITVLTDEDPRFEDRGEIIDQITKAALKNGAVEGKTLFRQPDRAKAIKMAIYLAKKGDTVGIFGKGHEKSMNYRGVEKPWSDQKSALKALSS